MPRSVSLQDARCVGAEELCCISSLALVKTLLIVTGDDGDIKDALEVVALVSADDADGDNDDDDQNSWSSALPWSFHGGVGSAAAGGGGGAGGGDGGGGGCGGGAGGGGGVGADASPAC